MITENLSTLKIHKLTQKQYERELENGNIDENALYLTPDEEIDLSGYATIDHTHTNVIFADITTDWEEDADNAGYYYQDVFAPGLLDDDYPRVSIYAGDTDLSIVDMYEKHFLKVIKIVSFEDGIRVFAKGVIDVELPIKIEVVR